MLNERELTKNNLTIWHDGNKVFINSPHDQWFVVEGIRNKLILFHKNRLGNQQKGKDFHKQHVCYSTKEIIQQITGHDEGKMYIRSINNSFRMIESGNIPKVKIC